MERFEGIWRLHSSVPLPARDRKINSHLNCCCTCKNHKIYITITPHTTTTTHSLFWIGQIAKTTKRSSFAKTKASLYSILRLQYIS